MIVRREACNYLQLYRNILPHRFEIFSVSCNTKMIAQLAGYDPTQ